MVRRTATLLFLALALLFGPPPADGREVKLRVVAEQANIRHEPDIGSRILYQAPRNEIFTSLEKLGEWHRIRYVTDTGDSLEGYVHESLVSAVEPSPRPQTPAKPREKPVPIKPVPIKPVTPPRVTPPPMTPPPATRKPDPSPQPTAMIPPPAADPSSPLEFSLSGGGLYASGGDLNRGAAGLADYYNDLLQGTSRGQGRPLHLGYQFGAEVLYRVASGLGVGAGVEILAGARESRVAYTSTDALSVRPGFQAVPIRVFVTYPILPGLYAKGGVEYIFAECSYTYRFEEGDGWQEWRGEARSNGPGLMAGLGFERPISTRLSLFVEALGRYARLGGFKGTDRYQDSEGREAEEEGTLFIYSASLSSNNPHRLLFVRDRTPSEAGVSDAGEAILDLSGISLRFGLRLRF